LLGAILKNVKKYTSLCATLSAQVNFLKEGNMENTIETQTEKEKLLPSPYDSTLALGVEVDLADWRYRCSGGSLQLGYAERDNLFIFTYGRSKEEELNPDLMRSRVRLGLLGVSLLAGSNGIVLYSGSIGRPIRTSVDYSIGGEGRPDIENKIIRLKHERYPEFRYSAEPFSIAHVTHPDVPVTPAVIAAIDELTNTGKVSIANLTVLSNATKAVASQYEPYKNWNYKELWTVLRDKFERDLDSHFFGDSEEMKKARTYILTSYLKWIDEMEEFSGLKNQNDNPGLNDTQTDESDL